MKSDGENKVICAVDQSALWFLNERNYSDYYFEGCVETIEGVRPTVRSEIGEGYSYKLLGVEEMAQRLKIAAPYFKNHPLARVKEDLLKAVAHNLEVSVATLSLSPKVEFVLFKASDGSRAYAHVQKGQGEVKATLFRWNK